MILRSEITRLAHQHGVPPSTIDKDWVLGHLIATIFRQEWSHGILLFKGGTCLKKCYFPEYRFSEDIDFTLLRDDFVLTKTIVQSILNRITQNTGIRFAPFIIQPITSKNRHFGYSTILKFWGGDHRRDQPPPGDYERWHSSIKIEMTWHELLCYPSEERPVLDKYSDSELFTGLVIPCCPLFEIIAEKLRATIQRSYPAPRDYYDLWYLTKEVGQNEWPDIMEAFRKKAAFKEIRFTSYGDFFQTDRINRSAKAWEQSLGSHLPAGALPPFSKVITELKEIIIPYFQ